MAFDFWYSCQYSKHKVSGTSAHTVDTAFARITLLLIPRYVPSQGDVAVFEALNGAPDAKFVNALRWYNQINSYTSNERLA